MPHIYLAIQEKFQVKVLLYGLKQRAYELSEMPPAQVARDDFAGVLPDVMTQLPKREAPRSITYLTIRQEEDDNLFSRDTHLPFEKNTR